MKPDPEDTVMDRVQRWSFGHHANKAAAATATRYRAMLRQATRFRLSDDLVRLTARMSHDMDRLEEFAALARLPFDTTWIEYDMHVKVREFDAMKSLAERMELDQVPNRCGVLLALDKPSASRWVATEFAVTDDTTWCQPCDLLFDSEGGHAEIVTGSTLWREKTLSRIPGLSSIPARIVGDTTDYMVPTEWPYYGVMETRDGSKNPFDVPEWASPKIGATRNAYWIAAMKGRDVKAQRGYLLDAKERRGALRFLVTLLAMIDSPPIKVFPAAKRDGSYVAGRTRQEYLGHSHITISVPKERALQLVGEYLHHESARRRRHKVRGHWRVIERGKRLATPCNHRPTMVEDGVGICLGCERLIRWIPWFMRGDASLGFVEQDYTVETHN